MPETPRLFIPPHVDFLQGLNPSAPGLARAQEPLVQALVRAAQYEVSELQWPGINPRLWFPYMYGPMLSRLSRDRRSLLHIGNAWYAHLVPLLARPTIVTCHDLIELEQLQRGAVHRKPHRQFHIRAAFRGMLLARRIACVSQATADRVIAHAPWVADHVRVVRSGVSPIFQPGAVDRETLRRLGIPQPYILYVGSEQPRKNVVRLVAAIAAVRQTGQDLHFVKIGAAQTNGGRAEFLAALKAHHVFDSTTIIDHVPDEQLLTLYRGAVATVLVSLDEGFGFPPLEAMACACPAIVSDRGALPEITGHNALAVDPLDVRAIARAIERIIADPELGREVAQGGRSWAATFTWERAASEYAALYDEILLGS